MSWKPNTAALSSMFAKAGWTGAQATIGALSADDLLKALNLPAQYKGVAAVAIAYVLSLGKNFVASRFGDPSTTRFDGPRRAKYPLAGLSLDELRDVGLFAYANVIGVDIVDGEHEEPIPPHGVNGSGETD